MCIYIIYMDILIRLFLGVPVLIPILKAKFFMLLCIPDFRLSIYYKIRMTKYREKYHKLLKKE